MNLPCLVFNRAEKRTINELSACFHHADENE